MTTLFDLEAYTVPADHEAVIRERRAQAARIAAMPRPAPNALNDGEKAVLDAVIASGIAFEQSFDPPRRKRQHEWQRQPRRERVQQVAEMVISDSDLDKFLSDEWAGV